eukprot:13325714-Heterocapsa_arctica.AAC.1
MTSSSLAREVSLPRAHKRACACQRVCPASAVSVAAVGFGLSLQALIRATPLPYDEIVRQTDVGHVHAKKRDAR